MKKIILFTLLAVSTVFVSAQNAVNVKWNVNAGIGVADYYGENTDGTDAKFAYRIGVGMELPFNNTWSLQSGLNLVSKGCKAGDSDAKTTFNPLYLELPILAGLRLHTANNFDVLFKAGPYLAYGIGGKIKAGGESVGAFDDEALKKFDAGLELGVGFEFNKFVLGLDSQFGMTNVFDGGGLTKPKNISTFVTFGYKL